MAELAVISAIAGVASAGIGAMGALQQGAAAKAAGDYQQKADIAAGKQARAEAQIPEFNQFRKGDVMSGKLLAAAPASGAGQGASVQDIYTQMGSLNDTQGREEGYKGLQRQYADNITGNNAEFMGNNAQNASYWNAAGTFLSGVSKAAGGKGSDFNFGS